MKWIVSLLRQTVSFLKSTFRWFWNNKPVVPLNIYAHRLNQCSACDWRIQERCSICGCVLKTKCHWATESCPIGTWQSMELAKSAPTEIHPESTETESADE